MPSIREIAEKIACFSLVAFHDNPIAVRAQMQVDIEQALGDERERCAKIADERAAFNRRLAATYKIGDPMADLKFTRTDEAEIIAKEIRED